MDGKHYLEDVRLQFHKYQAMADKATAQLDEKQYFETLDSESNSIAIVMKHMAGNMRSRWTDFLTTDGEKPDRHRDTEFVLEGGDDLARIRGLWQAGWRCVYAAIEPLTEDDLARTVMIRKELHTVVQALQRQLTHYAYHTGQIITLARHLKGKAWQSLSIPKGQSETWEVGKDGQPYFPRA